jgi:hypothetical protein
MDKKRWPEVGDLLIQTSNSQKHTGLITQIEDHPGLGRSRVFVDWVADDAPTDYNWTHGYSLVNIHNQYHVFELVKNHASR